jgi:hypothetical protein
LRDVVEGDFITGGLGEGEPSSPAMAGEDAFDLLGGGEPAAANVLVAAIKCGALLLAEPVQAPVFRLDLGN